MSRYFVVNEFFGTRVYDSKLKTEKYYTKEDFVKLAIKKSDIINYIDNHKSESMSAPLKISLNITGKCNLKCKQCFSNSGLKRENELTKEDLYNLFDDMAKYGTFFICIGGGEPLTREDIFDILRYGNKKLLAVSIVTNGLLLNKETIKKLNECNLDTLWISFEGSKENHDRLRGAATYDKAVRALGLLKKYYKGKTAIRMSLSKYNVDECNDIIKLAEDNNIDIVRFTPLLNFGRAKQCDLLINQTQYIKFLKNIKTIKTNVDIIYPTKPSPNKIWINKKYSFGCHCGKEALWIDELGNTYPCIFWGERFNIGNIRNKSYLEIWDDSLEKSQFKGNNICEKCSNYINCRGGCRFRSLDEIGDINAVDPLCPLRKNKGGKNV